MDNGSDRKKIVIVEDNQSLAEIYKTRLELIGYTCYIAYNGIIGLYFIQKEQPDLVLLDLMVPDIAGDEILRHMRVSQWGKSTPVYVISNLNEADAPAGLRDLGIAGYSVKANLNDDDIDNIVNSILRPAPGTPVPAQVVPESPAIEAPAPATNQPTAQPEGGPAPDNQN